MLKETDISEKPITAQVTSRGNLMYMPEKGLEPMPILMIDLTNPVPKVSPEKNNKLLFIMFQNFD